MTIVLYVQTYIHIPARGNQPGHRRRRWTRANGTWRPNQCPMGHGHATGYYCSLWPVPYSGRTPSFYSGAMEKASLSAALAMMMEARMISGGDAMPTPMLMLMLMLMLLALALACGVLTLPEPVLPFLVTLCPEASAGPGGIGMRIQEVPVCRFLSSYSYRVSVRSFPCDCRNPTCLDNFSKGRRSPPRTARSSQADCGDE
ncbi:hypothetical protein BO71DRAFT_161553 [Aspergillus ellipticus CBS 707.79]|uniref:Uncharacterized protein n=1 Tax=Aspergillus ellipticus CBS 707.79 TaxID=1448320 RepID=A0A319DZF8_9EURO|nr:hypothetical protein BO71DRAFT_161553 [Aspergillus ellipticus CBS 707.79]